jgi:hypothetical protein
VTSEPRPEAVAMCVAWQGSRLQVTVAAICRDDGARYLLPGGPATGT